MPGSICFQELRNIGDQGVIGIGVGEKGADGEQDLADGQCGAPLVLQDIETDTSVIVDGPWVASTGDRLRNECLGRKLRLHKGVPIVGIFPAHFQLVIGFRRRDFSRILRLSQLNK